MNGILRHWTLWGCLALSFSALTTQGATTAHAPQTDLNCQLWTDPQGITHVLADELRSTYACFGYVHARDRAWQMDYFRRTAQGRRAEVLGRQEIRSDFMMRLLGIDRQAARVFAALTPEQKELLQAYAQGANQGIEAAMQAGVYEFKEWDYRPEPWQAVDTVSLMLLQSFDQTRESFITDYEEYQKLKKFGKAATQLFQHEGLPWDTSILKSGEYPVSKTPETERDTGPSSSSLNPAPAPTSARSIAMTGLRSLSEQFPELNPPAGAGSNNWVVAAGLSKTGKAWLANDPHLELRHPSMWHLIHLQSPELDVIGAAVPGIPLIVSGTNRQAAWGLTNSYLKVSDLTLIPEEELEKNITRERPVIWFKLGKLKLPFFLKSFERTTHDRPILPLDTPPGKKLILNWSSYDLKASELNGIFELMRSSRVEEIDSALSRIGLPSWNFVFADLSGKIGYRAVGRTPRIEQKTDFGIREQSLAEFERRLANETILTPEEMPHVLNPRRGWIATANNRQWPSDARYYLGRSQRQGLREYRIEELLTRESKHDFDSMKRIQCDLQAIDARFLVPQLLRLTPRQPELAEALDLLKNWDFQAGLECRACAVYRRWISRIRSEAELNLTALYRTLQDTPRVGNLLSGTLALAIQDLKPGQSTGFPKWGEVHQCSFPHLSTRLGEYGEQTFFNHDGIKTPGDDETVSPGTSKWEQGIFQQSAGASQRLIVELSDPPSIYSILPGMNRDEGERSLDDPTSPWSKWVNCVYETRLFPLNWSKATPTRISLGHPDGKSQ